MQVVLSVTKIFYHLAPDTEAYKIGKPLARLQRTHRELQYVVLTNIATMASKRPVIFFSPLQTKDDGEKKKRVTALDMFTKMISLKDILHFLAKSCFYQQLFEPHMQSFFVRSTDPAFIRNLKLEVMTLIATEANISVLLKELQVRLDGMYGVELET